MEDIVIEKNVPIPPRHNSKGISSTLRSLKPGDCFVIPASWKIESVRYIAKNGAGLEGRRFAIRKRHPDAEQHTVWRLPDDYLD